MMIHPHHNSVDQQGMVYLPYLNQWKRGQSDLKTLVQKMCDEFAINCPVSRKADYQQRPMAFSPPHLYRPYHPHPQAQSPPHYHPDPYHASFPPPRYDQITGLQEELKKEKLKSAQLEEQLQENVTESTKLTHQLTEEHDEKIHQLQYQLRDANNRLESSDLVQAELAKERDTVTQLQSQLKHIEIEKNQLVALQAELANERDTVTQLQSQLKHIEIEKNQLVAEIDDMVYQQQQLQTQLQEVESEKKRLEIQRDEALHQQYLLQTQLQQKVCEQEQNTYSAKVEDKKSRFTQLLVPSQSDDDSWNVLRDEVKIFDRIGRGAWGIVSRGEFRNQTVAVKQSYLEQNFEESTIRQMRREIQVMAHVQHPNIVRFIAAVIDDKVYNGQDSPLLIIELLDMNLRDAYIRNTNLDVISIFQDVAYALHYLHEHQDPIFHRDVSAPNVLLKSLSGDAFQAKLSDLGSANKVKDAKTATTGAMCYIAPESLPPKNPLAPMPKPTTKIDVFSYGILLTEVITKTLPTVENRIKLFLEVQKQWQVMYDLVCQCIQENPVDRPTMGDVLSKLHRINASQ